MPTTALIAAAKSWSDANARCWKINKMWSIRTRATCSALKRQVTLTLETAWMSFADGQRTQKSRMQRGRACMTSEESEISRGVTGTDTESRGVVARGLGEKVNQGLLFKE